MITISMKNPRQHTIPRFYLNEFFPGFIYRRGEKSARFTHNAKNISVSTDYYGNPDEELIPLDRMNTVIENEAAPVLKRILADVMTMSRNDWITLSYFFANMAIRTPTYHKVILQEYQHLAKELNKMGNDMLKTHKFAKEKGGDLTAFNQPHFSGEKRFHLTEMNKMIEEMEAEKGQIKVAEGLYYHTKTIAECIQKMSLYILTARGGSFFVTTDRPLILFSIVSESTLGAGWGNSDAMAVLPLNPKTCLALIYRGKPAVYDKELSIEEVNHYNIEIMKYAQNEVYSRYPYDIAADWMHRKGIWSPPNKKQMKG